MNVHVYLFYALIVLLPTQLGFHMWPDWSLVLGRRIDYLSPTLFLTDILIVSLLISWISSFRDIPTARKLDSSLSPKLSFAAKLSFFTRWAFKKSQTRQFRIYIASVVVVVGFITSNIFFSFSRPVAIYAWIKLLEFGLLGLYIIKTKPSVSMICNALLIAISYSSLIAIAQFLLQHSIGSIFWGLGERLFTDTTPGIAKISFCLPFIKGCPLLLRPYATFSHPNVLGGFLATVIPLLIIQYVSNPIKNIFRSQSVKKLSFVDKAKLWAQRTIGISIVFGIIALVLTFSRSAWVVGILIMTFMYIVQKKQSRLAWSVCAIGIAFLMISVVSSFTLESESVVVREQLNTAALNIWKSAPFFGAGLGNFLVALPAHLPSRAVYFLQPVHNIYLLLLSEVGIVGVALIGWVIWKLIQDMKKKKYTLNNIYFMPLIGLLLLGLVDHYSLTVQQGRILFTILIACCYSQFASSRVGHDSQ